jgi:hypothetical protein
MQRNHHTTWAKFFFLMFLILLPAPALTADKNAKELTTLGNEAFIRGDFDTADRFYSEALEKKPDETALLYNRANVLYKQEKYDEALLIYQEALRKDPPRKLSGSLYFNTGNTYFKIAQQKNDDKTKEPIDKLKQRIAVLEHALDMYRKALESEREISIAEGSSIERSGLFARQNWALAREMWTTTIENLREIEKKNLKLEDGISELLHAKMLLLQRLEKIYLDSFTDDILTVNLKILAEYQKDYHEDVLSLQNIAAKEVERIQTEIDNLQANQPKQPVAASPQSQQPSAPNDAELKEQLQTAEKINKAVEQVASLDEWIVDGLTRGKPLEVWGNLTKMIGLLQDLTSFLKNSDPALSAYISLLTDLDSSELLLQQAAQLTKIVEKNDQAQAALEKRFNLAATKNKAGQAALGKINFYLSQMKEAASQEPDKSAPTGSAQSDSRKEEEAAAAPSEADNIDLAQVYKEAFTEASLAVIDELLDRNKSLADEIAEADSAIEKKTAPSLDSQKTKAHQNFAWYQHLRTPLEQSLAALIENLDTLNDRLDDSAGLEEADFHVKDHGEAGPSVEQLDTVLLQLQHIQDFLEKKEASSALKDQAHRLKVAAESIGKQTENLATAWKNYDALRNKEIDKTKVAELAPAADLLRRELLNTLIIFSPDQAIVLSFERNKKLHDNLSGLLPVTANNNDAVAQRYSAANNQAEILHNLLSRYFKEREQFLAAQENKEKQEAYLTSLNRRKNSPSLMERFIDQGKAASSLLPRKKFQLAELLFKEMSTSIDKARLAFLDQPDDGEKALNLAIDLQKKLESQSRLANEALTVNGKSEPVNDFLAASQKDINWIAGRGKEAIEQAVGMAEVPTHGQSPQAQPGNNQIDPAQLKKALEKIDEAQEQIDINFSFMTAGEFHNTFEKHQEIITLLQEALDLLKKKDEKTADDKNNDQQKDGNQDKQPQNDQQQGNDKQEGGQGEQRPQKPLELSAGEARELLEQLNQQDEKQQKGEAATVKKSFNTPRPW